MAGKSKHEIIGGYRVPGGASGAAVRFACEVVVSQPGIRQSNLLECVVKFSRLNLSTASWITSPGAKSPATILWDRRKAGGVFCCFPNELTPQCGGALKAMIEVWRSMPINCDWEIASTLTVGDIVVKANDGTPATFHGWTHKHTSRIFDSLEKAAQDLISPEVFARLDWGVPPYPAWSTDGKFYEWGESYDIVEQINSGAPFVSTFVRA